MVDVVVPDDRNIVTTQAWKIEWYHELTFEVQWIHQVEVVKKLTNTYAHVIIKQKKNQLHGLPV